MQNLKTKSVGADCAPHALRFLSMRDVQVLTGGKSRSTIWRWVKDPSNTFPAPVKISGHSIAWPEEAIAQWRESVLAQGGAV